MTPNIDAILGRLDNVSSAGKNKWRSRCPAHDGKDANLSITLMDDRSVRFKCFSHECTTAAIRDAIGADLFKKNNRQYYGPSKEQIQRAATVKAIADNDRARGETLSEEDEEAAKKAEETLREAQQCDETGKRKSQSTILIELATPCALFHTSDFVGYADIPNNGHYETWKIRSQCFRRWLNNEFLKLTGKGASNQAMQDALYTIEAKALFQNPEHSVHTRVAFVGNRIVIDLCNDKWEAIECDASGWRIVDESPVKFARPNKAVALPIPERGGEVDELRKVLNVGKDDFRLLIGWLLMALRGRGDFPVLVVHGEQGSAKSTLTQILRSLVDPSAVPLRGMWRTEDDLLVSASKSWCVVVDNLSYLSREMSDAVCRLSTGGGLSKRQLYTDDDEILIDVQRPVLMNGIDAIATQPDLLSRSLVINLPTIEDGNAREKEIVLNEFEKMRAGLFGALLDALSGAVRSYSKTKVDNLPRMTSFAIWVTAAESALGWAPGAFMRAYRKNLNLGAELSVEASPIGSAIKELMDKDSKWTGTATDLLRELVIIVESDQIKEKAWPKSPRVLSTRLRQLAPALRKIGIRIEYPIRDKKSRFIQLERVCN